MKSHNKTSKMMVFQEKEKPVMKKKTSSYIIPEILKETFHTENIQTTCSIESRLPLPNICAPQHQPIESLQATNFVIPPQQPLLPEALNPMNLINNSSSNNFNSNPHSASSLLLPPTLQPHHDPSSQISEQIHHFSNFESTTYLPPTPNMLSNSFNFMIGGLDFSKNNLNGEPTYIDY